MGTIGESNGTMPVIIVDARPDPDGEGMRTLTTPARAGGTTLEVRWIRPGALMTSMIEWFGPISREIENREDVYLVARGVRALSLKVRGGVQLDLKFARGRRHALDVPRRARGDIGSWQKWSFPLLPGFAKLEAPDWVTVRKIRRIRVFSFAGETPVERPPADGEQAWCAVEITDVSVGDERWWSLGFEATGGSATAASIRAVAELVLAEPVPLGPELRAADAMSYVDWLRGR